MSRESQAPGSFCLLAQALLCLNEPNEALEVLVHGMAMHPQDQRLHKLAYHAHVLLADTESALAAALTLLKMRPSDERAHYWAYLSLMSLARFDEAEQLLDASREEAPHFWAKYSSHFAQYKSLAVTWPAITAAWEAGLRNRPTHEAVASNADIQIDTIQYWSQGEPSSDLKLVIAQWNQVLRSIGLAEVHVHDRESAGAWITANAPEFQKAFSEAFHFAIEADIFRIAYASKKECIYIDIDSWPLAHCERILRQGLAESHSTLYFRAGQPSLNNSFFIARRGCKFFAELASQCASIELSSLPQNQMTVLQSFGPLRYESVLRTLIEREGVETVDAPEGVPAVSKLSFGDGAALLFANEFALAAQKPPFALDYRSTSDNWRGVSESTTAAATSEC